MSFEKIDKDDFNTANHISFIPQGFKIIVLADGSEALIPRSWIILPDMLTRPDVSTAIGVVKVYDPEGSTYPKFVFTHTHSEADSFTTVEMDSILAACKDICPELDALDDPASTAKVGVTIYTVADYGKVISLIDGELK